MVLPLPSIRIPSRFSLEEDQLPRASAFSASENPVIHMTAQLFLNRALPVEHVLVL